MVRIVNGQIVPDNFQPQDHKPIEGRQLFPSTYGKLGSLSESVALFGFKSELIWLLVLFIIGFSFGGMPLIVFAFILYMYHRNISVIESKKSRINTLR
jgi:hypothetical protein